MPEVRWTPANRDNMLIHDGCTYRHGDLVTLTDEQIERIGNHNTAHLRLPHDPNSDIEVKSQTLEIKIQVFSDPITGEPIGIDQDLNLDEAAQTAADQAADGHIVKKAKEAAALGSRGRGGRRPSA